MPVGYIHKTGERELNKPVDAHKSCLFIFSSIKILANSTWHALKINPGSTRNQNYNSSISVGDLSRKFPKLTNPSHTLKTTSFDIPFV